MRNTKNVNGSVENSAAYSVPTRLRARVTRASFAAHRKEQAEGAGEASVPSRFRARVNRTHTEEKKEIAACPIPESKEKKGTADSTQTVTPPTRFRLRVTRDDTVIEKKVETVKNPEEPADSETVNQKEKSGILSKLGFKALFKKEEDTAERETDSQESTESDADGEKQLTGFGRAMGVVKSIITWVFLIAAICMMLFTVISVSAFGQGGRSVFGYRFLIVQTNSMQATDFSAGDIVFIREVDPSTLKEGDIIAYTSQNTYNFGDTVTHKIRKITTMSNGEPGFVTYGTTTDTDDEIVVTYPYVLGKYTGRLPKVGRFFIFLKTTPGYILCILVPFLLLIGYNGINCVILFRRYKKEQTEEIDTEKELLAEERRRVAEERRQVAEMMKELQELRSQLVQSIAVQDSSQQVSTTQDSSQQDDGEKESKAEADGENKDETAEESGGEKTDEAASKD